MNTQLCVINIDFKRLDKYLYKILKEESRSSIEKYIKKEYILINNKKIKKNYKIKLKDLISINLKIEWLNSNIKAENLNLDIIFENKDFVIINKESWINVHPVPWEWWDSNTLVNWLLYKFKDKELPVINWVERPWIVHRLDKDTSWAIIIALNNDSFKFFQELFQSKTLKWNTDFKKKYIAIVSWIIKENWYVESYIWRDRSNRVKMTVSNPVNPKLAKTEFKVLWYWKDKEDNITILEVDLLTWRTHQIRVHLASIWYPVVWDKVYWIAKINNFFKLKYWLNRQALHSYSLEFNKDWKEYSIKAELKDDIKKVIE